MFVESIDEVPPGSPLLYSAHGVSPQIREQARRRRLVAIDATCPLVIKVHLEAIRYAREGYTIILIGHEGHDEVIGTMGEAPNQMILVETAEDVERLVVPDPDKVAYLTQTTLSVDDANIVIAALRKKFPKIANPPKDDICYATQNRQEAVRELAAQADLVLVLGSQNSSNSRRLAEIAHGLGIPSHLIDGVSEIRAFLVPRRRHGPHHRRCQAPEQVVQECIEYLETQLRRDASGRDGPQGKRAFPAARSRSGSCCPPRSARRRSATSTPRPKPSCQTPPPAASERQCFEGTTCASDDARRRSRGLNSRHRPVRPRLLRERIGESDRERSRSFSWSSRSISSRTVVL